MKGRCFIWPGSFNGKGYGRVYVGQKKPKKNFMAHRAIYEGCYGKIPKNLVIDHLCRNRACIKPTHMRVVTNKENVLCGFAPSAINARKTHCSRNHPLSGKNLKIEAGQRKCIHCRKAYEKIYYKKNRLIICKYKRDVYHEKVKTNKRKR